ncbi:TetR family transcriptional regulator, partial [Dietzia sp. E1]|nr:TetR family transcriptional regulator [Dietzia sp. E1]
MALTTTTVVDTALDLLRESGLPGMSMRTLATRLGVQPSALYWHVPSKQALLTAVAERILAAMGSVGSGASAAAELREVGAVLRAAVRGVPDGAEIVALGLAA